MFTYSLSKSETESSFDTKLFYVILFPMSRYQETNDLLLALLLVQNLIERRSEAFFKPFGLTAAQFNILNLLSDGKMDQATLVELLLVGKSSTSIVLNRMVRDDLVKREEHPKDRRQVVLRLTSKGMSLWREIAPSYKTGVEKVFGALPASRHKYFLQDLKTLHALLSGEASAEFEDRWLSLFPAKKAVL